MRVVNYKSYVAIDEAPYRSLNKINYANINERISFQHKILYMYI